MQAVDLAGKITRIAEQNGDAEQIDDAVVAYITHCLRDNPQQDAGDMIATQAEAVSRELQNKRVPYRLLGQVYDSFRREENSYRNRTTPHVPTAAALAPPSATATQTRAATPAAAASAVQQVNISLPQQTNAYANRSRPFGGGYGPGTNSGFWQMEAMQADMNANALMMEGAMLDMSGNLAAGEALQADAMMLENQADMDRMMGGGNGGGFGLW